jgi:hypothetical protein
MRRTLDHEPDNLDANVIAGELQSRGLHRMATFVRQLGGGVQAANREAMQLRQELSAVLERLHVYEPPAPPRERVSYKPGPMSDG